MQDFRNLAVWRRAHELTLAVYAATKSFPRDELFGLTSQLRRGAVSIGSNIAEGCGRGSDDDFCRFLQMSLGAASELLARDLGYVSDGDHDALTNAAIEVKRMLTGLIRRVREGSASEADS